MALIDVAIRPGYIGGSQGLIRITLGRVSLEGYREDADTDEGPGTPFVWFEGLRREGWFDFGTTRPVRWRPDNLISNADTMAGFPVIS